MIYQEELTIERPNSSRFGDVDIEFVDKMLSSYADSSLFYKNVDWTSMDVSDLEKYHENYAKSLGGIKPIDRWVDSY